MCACVCVTTSYQMPSICFIHYSFLPSLWAILLLLSIKQIYPPWPRAGSLITVIIFNKRVLAGESFGFVLWIAGYAWIGWAAWDSISETVRAASLSTAPASLCKMQSTCNQGWHRCLQLDSGTACHTAHGDSRQWQTVAGLRQDTINRLEWSFPVMESL